jgi:hypothetical protein
MPEKLRCNISIVPASKNWALLYEVELTPKDWASGHDPQLEKAVALIDVLRLLLFLSSTFQCAILSA